MAYAIGLTRDDQELLKKKPPYKPPAGGGTPGTGTTPTGAATPAATDVLTGENRDNEILVTPEVTGIPETTTTPTNPYDDLQPQYDALYQAQQDAAIAGLRSAAEASEGNLTKAFNSSLSGLDTAQSGIRDTFYGKRNEAAAQNDIGAMNFAQYMASRGIKGSAGGMPEIYRNAGLQNNLGRLNTAEAQENSAIDRQRSLTNSNYQTDIATLFNKLESDITATGAEFDAQALETKIGELRAAADRAAAQTAADKNSWLDTMGRFSGDYQAEINSVKGDGDISNDWQIPYLEAGRVDKLNALAQQQTAGGNGGGGYTQSFSQLDNQLQDMYNQSFDPNSGLSDAGRQAMYNYVAAYGGQYSDQLLAKWGLTGYQPATQTVTTQTPGGTTGNNGALVNQLISVFNSDISNFGVSRDHVAGQLAQYPELTEQDIQYIISQLDF
jgi:hypothetical protein